MGVRIFFALSGFLITSLLLAEENTSGEVNIKSFYVRRFFRIMPAAATFLVTVGILSASGIVDVTPRRWIDVLFFFANYSSTPHSYAVGHFWSLAVEEHFYFVWPTLLIVLATLRKRVLIAVTICLVVAIWRALAWKYQITTGDPATFWGRTDINVDAILWGAVVAILATNTEVRLLFLSGLARLLVPLAYAGFLIGVLVISEWKVFLLFSEFTFITAPILIFQTSQLDTKSLVLRVFEWPPIRWLGHLSYSIYLWQQLFLTPEQQSVVQIFPLNLLAAICCATVCYYLIERPARTFHLRFAKWPSRVLDTQ